MTRRFVLIRVICGLAAAVVPVLAAAQVPTAAPADVATIDALVRASYGTMSGPAGQPRQWARDSTLYMPAATFVALRHSAGHAQPVVMTPEEYRRRSFPGLERDGGYEVEIGRHTERFGDVAQVRSVASFRRTPTGPVLARYVNYYQLYYDGTRWWVAGMVWDEEQPARPIPTAWVGRWTEGTRYGP